MFAEVTVPKLILTELRLPKIEWYIDGKNTDYSEKKIKSVLILGCHSRRRVVLVQVAAQEQEEVKVTGEKV